jgi:hypothetical protein
VRTEHDVISTLPCCCFFQIYINNFLIPLGVQYKYIIISTITLLSFDKLLFMLNLLCLSYHRQKSTVSKRHHAPPNNVDNYTPLPIIVSYMIAIGPTTSDELRSQSITILKTNIHMWITTLLGYTWFVFDIRNARVDIL